MHPQGRRGVARAYMMALLIILVAVASSFVILGTRNHLTGNTTATTSTYLTTGGGLAESNGTTILTFFESGADNGGAFVNVRNDGSQPVFIKALYLNGLEVDANGTERHFVATNNPIQPGQLITLRAVYNTSSGFVAGSGVKFVIVTDQGTEVIYWIDLYGGLSKTG